MKIAGLQLIPAALTNFIDVSYLCCVRDDAYDAGDAAEGAEDGISMIRHPKP